MRVFLSVVLVAGLCPTPSYAASGPGKSDVLAVLKKYDKDGYHIVKTMDERGDDFMQYWGSFSVFDSFDTVVHEECHGYMGTGGSAYRIYIGNKKSVEVGHTDVFLSKEIAKSVPKKLRGSRYKTYVAKPSSNLGSNVLGVYGLLDEFTAYCWGFNNTVKLYGFAKRFKRTDAVWLDYASGSGIALAYVEFRYFIEHYLYYARGHNPRVYAEIMGNERFTRALREVDGKFASLVKTFDGRFPKIAAMLRHVGYKVYYEGDSLMVGTGNSASGRGLSIVQYNRFAEELNMPKYRKIEKELRLKQVKKRAISVGSKFVANARDDAKDVTGDGTLSSVRRHAFDSR